MIWKFLRDLDPDNIVNDFTEFLAWQNILKNVNDEFYTISISLFSLYFFKYIVFQFHEVKMKMKLLLYIENKEIQKNTLMHKLKI